jgi:hypothetical protein
MTWRTGFAIVALALFALGTGGAGVSPAGTFVPGAAASGPAGGAPDNLSPIDPFAAGAVTNGANPAGAPRVGPGNTVASEDNAGDEDPGAGGDGATPRDRSFTAVYDEDQAFAARSFLVPPATGPPAA